MNNIKMIRITKGMTMREVAIGADITEGHLGNIENGRNDCTSEVAKRIAKVLDVPLDELLSEPTEVSSE